MVNKTALLFPGQGSQSVGMGKNTLDKNPSAKSIFQEADKILGFALTSLMFDGPEEKLKETKITQPALFTASVAALSILKNRDITPSFVAGHSLGEYSALYAAGAIDFESALKLVQVRGEAMQQTAEINPGTMAAIIGLDPNTINDICKTVVAEGGVCAAANYNAPTQTVIAGTESEVEKAITLIKQAGAMKVVRLNVSGAFHSSLMTPAIEKVKQQIDKTHFRTPQIPLISNVDAQPTSDINEIKDKLIRQIDHPVQWNQTIETMMKNNIGTFIEVGPGKVLSSIVKRMDRTKCVLWTDDIDSIEKKFAIMTPQL